MSWPGIPRAAACVTHLMRGGPSASERESESAGRTYWTSAGEKDGREGEVGPCHPPLDMLVCTQQSLNRCDRVRKACVLCDKLTPGYKNTQRKRRRRARRVGGWGGGRRKKPQRAWTCFFSSNVLSTKHPCSEKKKKKCPHCLQRNPDKRNRGLTVHSGAN